MPILEGQLGSPWNKSHQNLLAQQEKRLQDAWKNVFPDTIWEVYFYLQPGEEPPEDRAFCGYVNHVDGAVRNTL
ncbi:hypothetical protein V8E54_003468 [Elaphomyces granulatus]